jgi:RHH-type rel operon transcriptional repressor/antitoxin RelB
MSTITIDVDEETKRRLDELSSGAGVTTSYFVREMIDSYLEDMEDAKDAEEVLNHIARGEEGVITLDELEQRLGLDS